MFLIYTFILSGAALALLMIAKRMEEKRKKPVAVLRLISLGDARVRGLHHEVVRHYSNTKEKAHFFIKKQLPRYSRSSLNKILTRLEEGTEKYIDNLRDSRLLKKSDGISEFFKTMSEVEKGAGEINEPFSHEDIYTQEEIASSAPSVEFSFEVDPPKEELLVRKTRAKRKMKVLTEEGQPGNIVH